MAIVKSSPSRLRLTSLVAAALAAMLLALSLAAPSWSQASSKIVGITAALINDVGIKPASLTQFAPAKLRQRVALADQVRTGPDSRLQIALLDRTKITVGANAQLTIDKFIYDPNGGSVSVTVAKGALRFMSGSTKSNRSVGTPAATIGIRGTIFDTAVGALAVQIAQRERAIPQDTQHDPLTATLAVLRGPGPNRKGKAVPGAIDVNAAGQTVALEKPLLAAYVPYAGAQPIGPFTISPPGLNLLNGFILPPPPKREFLPASEGHPVPHRERTEPPPWVVDGMLPPPGEARPGPDVGAPGGVGTGLPTFPRPGTAPPPPAGTAPTNQQAPPPRTLQTAPTNAQPVGTPTTATGQQQPPR